MHTRLATANRFDLRLEAPHLVHIGRRSANITNHSFEIGVLCHRLHLALDRFPGARLNDSSLVRRDRAEGTAAETSPHDRDRVFDHFESRNRFVVGGVGLAGIGQFINRIHRSFGDWQCGWIGHDRLTIVPLNESPRVVRIGFVMNHLRRVRKRSFVLDYLFIARQREGLFRRGFRGAQRVGHTTQIAQIADCLTRIESTRNL